MITDLLRWRHHNITVRGPSTASTAVCVVADPRLPRTVSATAAAGPPAMRDGTGGGRRGGAATKRRRWPGARRAARLRRFAALGAESRIRHAAAVTWGGNRVPRPDPSSSDSAPSPSLAQGWVRFFQSRSQLSSASQVGWACHSSRAWPRAGSP